MNDPLPILDKIDQIRNERPQELVTYYRKVFGTPEGEIVLVDLMDHFFEFRPTVNDMQAGSRAVIVHIKNQLLGITHQPLGKEIPDDNQPN